MHEFRYNFYTVIVGYVMSCHIKLFYHCRLDNANGYFKISISIKKKGGISWISKILEIL